MKILLCLIIIFLILAINTDNFLGDPFPKGYFQFTDPSIRFGGQTKQGCYFDMNNTPVVNFYTNGTPMNQISISLTNGCYKSGTLNGTPSWDPRFNHFSMEYTKDHHLSITFNYIGNNQYNAVVSLTPPGSNNVSKTSQTQAIFIPTD
jgi:hypothetical protein